MFISSVGYEVEIDGGSMLSSDDSLETSESIAITSLQNIAGCVSL